ncbi:MAG TPA: hypothetical protein DF966_18300 [Sulfitobacter sp.]|nr:hypothetical protein [Sulfitobacter sp.]|tara:strand:+ start:524 stop:808 length:285 start_codon:yes stop_codon:yes gene_type:complete
MTAHTNPTAAKESLAARILAGDIPSADYPLYSDQAWTNAADMALDCEDESELEWMLDNQRQHDADNRLEALDAWFGRGAHNCHMIERAMMEAAS